MKQPIVVAGALAQRPYAGGHAWVFLQYLLGFRRLGFAPYFVDWLDPAMCDGAPAKSPQARYLAGVLTRYGLSDSFTLLDGSTGEVIAGEPRATGLTRARDSLFVLNVMGYLQDEELLAASPRRVFLDIDPGFPQMWHALGLAEPFAEHDAFVTVGANIGSDDCAVPTCGLHWIPTRPPVVLEHWPRATAPRLGFTTVASWRGAFAPVDYHGHTYGLRVHQFRRFAELPDRTGKTFDVALDIHPAEEPDLALLAKYGWRLLDPLDAAGEPESFARFVAESAAEFMVAKGMYVDTRGGWFSDRSACYLACGRPVLAQQTGLDAYPTGLGLVPFSTLDDAIGAVESITATYDRHAAAARELAEAYFDSDLVLTQLIEAVT